MFSDSGKGIVVAGTNNLIVGNILKSSGSVVDDTSGGATNTKDNNVQHAYGRNKVTRAPIIPTQPAPVHTQMPYTGIAL